MSDPPRCPRRFVRPIRRALLVVLAAAVVWGFWNLTFVRLPDGPSPLFDVPPGARIVVRDASADRAPRRGDAVLYGTPEGTVALGRIVALAGDELEVDEERGRIRGPDGAWSPAPPRAIAALPLEEGEVLVLAEDPVAADAGAVVERERIVGRVLVALPF